MPKQPRTLQALRGERYFRWRGADVSRLEGLTDAVMALAMTLLIVSFEVPTTWAEMTVVFQQVPVLLICFAMMVMLWFYNFQFHRRFGLENIYTVMLNAVFMFLVLVYVYPLKFLFSVLVGRMMGIPQAAPGEIDGVSMMVIYSAGVVAIFGVLFLMNLHAYKHRDVLELDLAERHLTRASLREHAIHMSFGATSILLALCATEGTVWLLAASGMVYFGVGPAQGIAGYRGGKKLEAALAREAAAEQPALQQE
jgi:uncharacterized membrane protein